MTQQDHWKDTLWPTIAASGETLVTLPGTTATVIPVGSTAQRPASPVNGMMRFNTDLADFEAYNGVWAILATLAGVTLSKLEDGDLNTQVFVENFTGVDDNIIAFTMGDNSGTYTMPAAVLNWSTAGFGIETPSGSSSNAGVGFTVTTGAGNVAAAGGTLNLITGAGGTNGNGGDIGLLAGAGGATTGNGGSVVFAAGDAAIGLGGLVSISAGDSGTGNIGGDVSITAGNGTAAAGGSVNITGGDSTTGIGGEIILSPGLSVAAAGAPFSIIAGAGDGAANSGGAISITGGEGDVTNGAGGAASVIGGAGGSSTGGNGGDVNILGGLPQMSGTGGDVNVTGGNSLGIAAGGTIAITAGSGGTVSGVGGALLLNAGAGGNGDVGGAVTITTGVGSGSGDGGDLSIIAGDGGGGGGELGGSISAITGSGAGGSGAFNISTANATGVPAGDITLTAGTGSPHGAINMVTGGATRFTVEDDGTLSTPTASYEALVLADNDMPNKKYVDDAIVGGGSFLPLSGGTMTGAINAGAFAIGNVLDPVIAQDAATMNYVDTEIAAALHPYDIHANMGSTLPAAPAGTNVYRWTFPRAVTLGTGGHFAYCDALTTASVAPATFNLHVSSPGGGVPGASIGTVTFAVASQTGVVSALGPLVLAAGDELILTYTTPDTGLTLARVVIGILANA